MDLKRAIATIVSPFAVSSSILLLILSLLEFWRRGFVSLFLDLRTVMIVTLLFWVVAIFTDDKPRYSRLWSVVIAIALLVCLPMLWFLTAPFGRLGLLTFGIGVIVLLIIVLACLPKVSASDRGFDIRH